MSAEDFLDEKGDSLADNGRLVKLVSYQNDALVFDKDLAKSLFECSEVKSNQVVIVTALGKGKSANSMLLSKIIHHMQNLQSDGVKMSEADIIANFKTIVLESSQDEVSIVTWSKPFFVSLGVRGQVAVFFLNVVSGTLTENMLDLPEDQIRKYYELAGLCLHLSSDAVYIEMNSLTDVDWGHVARATGEGLRCAEHKKHQKITFLIRHWIHPSTFSHGEKGGNKALKHFIDVNPSPGLVSQIPPAFSELNCFLLPPFGADYEEQAQLNFDRHYKKFLQTVLDPCYITTKQIGGSSIEGSEIVELIQDYIASVKRNDPPIDLVGLCTGNKSPHDSTESQTLDKILAELRTEKHHSDVIESSNLSRNEGTSCELKPHVNVEVEVSLPRIVSGRLPSSSTPKISLDEYLRSERMNKQERTENIANTTDSDSENQSKKQVHQSHEESQQLLRTTDLVDILKKYRRPVEYLFKGTTPQSPDGLSAQSLSPDITAPKMDDMPLIHKYDSSDAILEFTQDAEYNSNHTIHNDSTIAADFAVGVAVKYFKSEIIKAMKAARNDSDLQNAKKEITGKINNVLKSACELSATELTRKHEQKLQTELDMAFRDVQKEIPKSAIGISLSMDEITACAFVGGNCEIILNSCAPGNFTDGIWFSNSQITFENPGAYGSTYVSLKQILSASAGIEVDRGRFLSVNELLGIIFLEIKQLAASRLNSTIPVCVLALPANFSHITRSLIRDSARLAGFERVELINESSVAAISYTMELDSPTPEDLLLVIHRENAWDMACFALRSGQLTLKSILGQEFSNGRTRSTKPKSMDLFGRMTLQVKEKANFGDNTMTLHVSCSGAQIPLFVKEQAQHHRFTIRRSIVARGAAIYAGLIGGNSKLRANWAKAVSSECTDWENVLSISKKSGLRG